MNNIIQSESINNASQVLSTLLFTLGKQSNSNSSVNTEFVVSSKIIIRTRTKFQTIIPSGQFYAISFYRKIRGPQN